MRPVMQIFLVAIGSAGGGVLRWGASNLARWLVGTAFPFGTLFVNITGSLFLGWFYTRVQGWAGEGRWLTADNLTLFLGVGLAGGYTTFSSFEWEGFGLFQDNLRLTGTIYMIGSLALGLIAVRIGVALGRI